MPKKNKPTRVESEHEINSATTENGTRKVENERKEIYTTYFGYNRNNQNRQRYSAKKIIIKIKARENIER